MPYIFFKSSTLIKPFSNIIEIMISMVHIMSYQNPGKMPMCFYPFSVRIVYKWYLKNMSIRIAKYSYFFVMCLTLFFPI